MRRFESDYRINEGDDVLNRENAIHQDVDLRLDAVEQLGQAFAEGNRADIEAILASLESTFSGLAAEMRSLLDQTTGGLSADIISETAARYFLTDERIAAIKKGLVSAGAVQSFTAVERAQAKQNLRVDAPSFTFAQATVLTAEHIGAAIGCDPGCTSLTLPRLSTVESGAAIHVSAYTQAVTVNVDAAEPLGLFLDGAANKKSVVVQAGWTLTVRSRGGTVWLPTLTAPGHTVPNSSLVQSFTQAQRKTLKQNIGAGGLVQGINGTISLLATSINSLQFLQGSGYTASLPASSNWVNGDFIEFSNIGTGPISVARNAGDTNGIYFGAASPAANISVGVGQTLRLTYDGANFIASGRAIMPERAVSVDAQAFTAAQARQARNNVRTTGYAAVYLPAQSRALTVDDVGLQFYTDGACTITLPADNTCQNGDTFDVLIGSPLVTLNNNASSSNAMKVNISGNPAGVSTIGLYPGAYRVMLVLGIWTITTWNRAQDSYPGVGDLVTTLGNVAPPGCLKLNGGVYQRATYPQLWAWALASTNVQTEANWPSWGGTFSSGDGSTTFRVPDLRGEFLRGFDDGRNLDSGRALGQVQAQNIANHKHLLPFGFDPGQYLFMWSDQAGNPVFGSTVLAVGGASLGGKSLNVSNFNGRFAYTQEDAPVSAGETRPRNISVLHCVRYK